VNSLAHALGTQETVQDQPLADLLRHVAPYPPVPSNSQPASPSVTGG
jgi:hypothetical protein